MIPSMPNNPAAEDLIYRNQEEADKARAEERAKPLTIEERVQFLETLFVTRELAMSLDGTVRQMGREAPVEMVLDSLYAGRKYMKALTGMVMLVGERAAGQGEAGEKFAELLAGLMHGVQGSLEQVEKRIHVMQEMQAQIRRVEGNKTEQAPKEAEAVSAKPSGLLGPDGRPLG